VQASAPRQASETRLLSVALEAGAPAADAEVIQLRAEQMFALFSTPFDSFETAAREVGTPLRSDEQGRIFLNRDATAAAYLGIHGGSRGWLLVESESSEPLRLELKPAPRVSVHVTGQDGLPVGGVLLMIRARSKGVAVGNIAVGRTSAKGALEYLHFAPLFDSLDPDRWSVGLAVMTPEGVEASYDPAAPPPEPLHLVLPATGSVAFRTVGSDGTLSPNSGFVHAYFDGAPESATSVLISEGVGTLENVALNQRLKAMLFFEEHPGGKTIELDGPKADGEVVRFDIAFGDPTAPPGEVLVHGRLVYADGSAVARERVRTLCNSPSYKLGGSVKTGAKGEFQWSFQANDFPDAAMDVSLLLERPNGESFEATKHLNGRPPVGSLDLGDVTLSPSALCLAGRVVGPAGLPVGGAKVQVSTLTRVSARLVTDEAGRFELRGRAEDLGPSRSVDVRVSHQGLATSGWMAFAHGSGDIVITMEEPLWIEGQVLLPDGVRASDVGLATADAGGELDRSKASRMLPPPGADGTFLLGPVGGSACDVQVWLTGTSRFSFPMEGAPLLTVRDVDPRAAADPRLCPIDLRGKIHVYEIVAVDESGVSLASPTFAYWDREARIRQYYEGIHGRKVNRIVTADRPARVRIDQKGFRSASVELTETRTEVVLKPGLPVRIRVTNQPSLGATGFLGVRLSSLDESSSPTAEGDLDPSGTGVIRFPWPGRYRLGFQFKKTMGPLIWSGEPSSWEFHPEIEVLDVEDEQTFDVELDAKSVEIFRSEGKG
jgi:hypothetical protein